MLSLSPSIRFLLAIFLAAAALSGRCCLAMEALEATTAIATFSTSIPCVEVSAICGTCPTTPANLDQVWLVSTRNLSCASSYDPSPKWKISRRTSDCWTNAAEQDLFASAQPMRTVIYVHGNRVDSSYALEGGMRVYRNLVKCRSDEPIRFIIWSWCSDRLPAKLPLRDARVKADLADWECIVFGRFLSRFSAEDRVGLVGFSFGARIITGGLHLVGGGTWQGVQWTPATELPRYSVVLWAAAEDNHWLCPNGAHGRALDVCPVWLNMINPSDEALRFYPRLDRSSSQPALGYTGVAGKSAIESRGIVFRECTVQHLVGDAHKSAVYPLAAGVMNETRAIVLGN